MFKKKLLAEHKAPLAFIGACLTLAISASGALFTSDESIPAGDTTFDGQDIVVIGCTLTIDGPHSFSDVLIIENGVITHSPVTNSLDVGLDLAVSNNFVIEAGSEISVDGQGYEPGTGPGAGVSASGTSPFGLEYTSGGGARTRDVSLQIKGLAAPSSQTASQKSDLPAELQRVVEFWPRLSAPLKDAILVIINTAAKYSGVGQ